MLMLFINLEIILAITNVEETIWTEGGIYVYPTSAEAVYISSTDANDTSAGTGARTVKVFGLDANWELQEETVILNGQTQVRVGASLTWIRIFRAFVVTVGSGGTAAGEYLYWSNRCIRWSTYR